MSKTLSDALAEAVDNPKRSGKVFLDLLQTRIDRTDQEIVSKEENQAVASYFHSLILSSFLRAQMMNQRRKKRKNQSQKKHPKAFSRIAQKINVLRAVSRALEESQLAFNQKILSRKTSSKNTSAL